MVLQYVQ